MHGFKIFVVVVIVLLTLRGMKGVYIFSFTVIVNNYISATVVLILT